MISQSFVLNYLKVLNLILTSKSTLVVLNIFMCSMSIFISEIQMGYKDKKEKYKPEILRLLSNQQFGMIASQIKKDLDHELSRNTIQSYLDQLAAEKKVQSVRIGRYEVWHHKKNINNNIAPKQSLLNHPIFPFLSLLLKELENSPGYARTDWKQFGLKLGKSFRFAPYFPAIQSIIVEEIPKMHILFREIYPPVLRQILIYFGDDSFELDPPIIQPELNNVIFRIRQSKYYRSNIFFHLLCGIEEAEINQFFPIPIKIDVLQQIPDKKIVDLNVKINSSVSRVETNNGG